MAMADDIVRTVYGEDLADAATVLRILSINIAFFSLISVFWRSLVARGGQRTNLVLQTFTVAVRLCSGVALIAPFAAVGAAIASTASSAVHLALLLRATARSGAPMRVLQVGWPFAVAAAGSGLAMWGLDRWLPTVASMLAGSALYLPLLLAVGAITLEDRQLWRRVRRARVGATGGPS
jgi:O-antigen/teichoic acid export membrane protein